MKQTETVQDITTLLTEECAELIQALCKLNRYNNQDQTLRTSKERINTSVIEEIADVEICLKRIKRKLNITHQVKAEKKSKRRRTEKILQNALI